MKLTIEQVNTIIKNGKQQTQMSGQEIFDGLIERGYEIENTDMAVAKKAITEKKTLTQKNIATQQPQAEEEKGFGQRVKQDFAKGSENIKNILASDSSTFTKVAKQAAQITSMPLKVAYEALPKFARKGLESVGKGIGSAINWVADKVSDNPALQKWASDLPEEQYKKIADALEGVSAVGQTVGNVAATYGMVNTAYTVGEKAIELGKRGLNALEEESQKLANLASEKLSGKDLDISTNMMQKVAKISPARQARFQKMTGENVGEYFTKRKMFGDPEKLMEQLYKRFELYKGKADAGLAELPGEFKPPQIKTALDMLKEKATSTSTPGAPSPYLDQVTKLADKFDDAGLNMTEINAVKRLLEKNVKVDYLKQNLPALVEKTNNIDSAIRTWQFDKAAELGFKTLPAINKETQAAMQLLNDLGATYAGNANSLINLTDWIVLSGGSPTAIAAFLVKKGFSNKSVQSAIAKYMARNKTGMAEINPEIQPLVKP